ncbi:HAMP domain-containing histidine kinase [bacterium]|nr:HAMP domain-containing histidine kinase [bacterium]
MGKELIRKINTFKTELMNKCINSEELDDVDYLLPVLQEYAEEKSDFHLNDLGLGVGSIFLIDSINRELIPLFTDHMGQSAFGFQYQPRISRTHNELFDAMFSSWRLTEELGSLIDPLSSEKYPPEYLYYMLPEGYILNYNSDQLSITNNHYVSAGEIIFFMLLWRILLRDIQFNTHRQEKNRINIIFHETMREYLTYRECKWLEFISSGLNLDLINLWKNQIELYFDFADNFEDSILKDLIALKSLMVPSSNGEHQNIDTSSLLFKYVESKIQTNAEKKQLELFMDFYTSNNPTGICSIDVFISTIKSLFYKMFYKNNESTESDPIHMLNQLHLFARFPILPYFYWCLCSKRIWCHLTFPVWYSPSPAYLIHSAFSSNNDNQLLYNSYCNARESLPTIKTTAVAFAVLSITPINELDQSIKDIGYNANSIEVLKQYIRIYSDILIDSSFYKRIQRKSIELDATEYIANTYIHEVKGVLNEIIEIIVNSCRNQRIPIEGSQFEHAIEAARYQHENFDSVLFKLRKKITVDSRDINLNTLINEVVNIFQRQDKNVIYSDKGVDIVVIADDRLLKNILWELIINAIEKNRVPSQRDNRKLKILIENDYYVDPSTETKEVVVTVSDNGKGLPKELKEGYGLSAIKRGLRFLQDEVAKMHINYISKLWIDSTHTPGVKICFNLPIMEE